MIGKNHRVPSSRIDYILKKGETRESKLFIKKFATNEDNINRFSIIVSRKIEPKAVKRNSLRRQIYEAIRLNIPESRITTDSVLIPKKKILEASYQEIEADIKSQLTPSDGEVQ